MDTFEDLHRTALDLHRTAQTIIDSVPDATDRDLIGACLSIVSSFIANRHPEERADVCAGLVMTMCTGSHITVDAVFEATKSPKLKSLSDALKKVKQ